MIYNLIMPSGRQIALRSDFPLKRGDVIEVMERRMMINSIEYIMIELENPAGLLAYVYLIEQPL